MSIYLVCLSGLYFSLLFWTLKIARHYCSAEMSSAGSAGSAAEKRYFCHQCNRTFTFAGSGLACAHCHGDFIEELDLLAPNPSPDPLPDRDLHFAYDDSDVFDSIPSLFSSIIDFAASIDDSSAPFGALRDIIQSLTFAGSGGGGRHLLGNVGDYFVGPGFEQLIQQLAENDPNRYGTPPASKAAVESLLDVVVTEGLLSIDEAQCSVCMDTFQMGTVAKKMPCSHVYHKDCILPWLELHNSCPVCRYELPTDDPDYEHYKAPRTVSGEVEGNSSVSGGATDHEDPAFGTDG